MLLFKKGKLRLLVKKWDAVPNILHFVSDIW
jgi:hypothetical protein